MHDSSYFLTLTYDQLHLPENASLQPQHVTRFIKDLRKHYRSGTISYFACGEYGDQTLRPHYHAILYGATFPDLTPTPGGARHSAWMEALWGRGRTEIGTVTMASASYVAGYVQKKVLQADEPDHLNRLDYETGELITVKPEFARMSLRPAIGKRWIERHWQDVYPRDYVVIDGIRSKPPRYYDKWMDANQPDVMADVRDKRWNELESKTREQLAAAQANHDSRRNLYRRDAL